VAVTARYAITANPAITTGRNPRNILDSPV
jgi:hypothetical protein